MSNKHISELENAHKHISEHENAHHWPRLNIKTVFSGMGIFHYEDKKVVIASYLYDRNAFTAKPVSLYWNGPQSYVYFTAKYSNRVTWKSKQTNQPNKQKH